MPRHDDGILLESRLQNLVPADDPPAVSRKVAADSLSEGCLTRCGTADAGSPGAGLHPRRGIPLVLDRLIAADVNGGAGKELGDFREDILEKTEGMRFQIEEVGVYTPAGGDAQRSIARGSHRGVRGDCRRGMTRHFYFRDDLHVAGRGETHDVAPLALGGEAARARAVRGRPPAA